MFFDLCCFFYLFLFICAASSAVCFFLSKAPCNLVKKKRAT